MYSAIVKVKIDNELDIVVAHKRARQLATLTGLNFSNQAKYAAAISEISRNTLEHANGGEIMFYINEISGSLCLSSVIRDEGNGISDINKIMNAFPGRMGKGVGIKNTQRLVDFFNIQSESGKGTQVELGMKLPANHPPINRIIIKGWAQHFLNEKPVSPYEELKKQNDELIDALEQLKYKNLMVENQLEEIKRLNTELQKQNAEISSLSKDKERRNKQLEEKNKQLDEFSYIVTHDLKAPLNNMLGLIDVFKDEIRETNINDEFEMFVGQVEKMQKLVGNIVSYTRSGKENIVKSNVNLSNLLEEIIKFLPSKDGVSVEVPRDIPSIYTEEIYLEQIFNNLIGNALKYHDKKQGSIKISYKVCENGMYQFGVCDDGPGVPDGQKDKVFDLFHTINQNRSIESTGIGLAIVKKIIESKGGNIWIEDNIPFGANFMFTWPASASEEIVK
ncbi:sensor histidine kinase [Sporocytophaga myxococcoides]|uniref:sensor histidine kinase n=1 Tax=Sporocytophaga myxococcoides TaxID=153721 RepID=UPI0003FE0D01|nr:sensor histidine kinase [Sporocytophaga myxococcoides]